MSSNDDDGARYGLAVVAGVVALVVVAVLALAIRSAGRSPAASSVAMPAPVAALVSIAADTSFAPPEKLYFAIGSDALPVDSDAVLSRFAEAARAQNGVSVLISGFHDASGDAQANADLAKRRAKAVHHALESYGVAPERLVMSKPEATTGGADDKEARRVELRLR